MAEGEDEELVAAVVDEVCAAIREAAAAVDSLASPFPAAEAAE